MEHRLPEMHTCDMVKAYEPVTVLRETKKVEFRPRSRSRMRINLPQVRFTPKELRDMIIAIVLFIFAFEWFNQMHAPGGSSFNILTMAALAFGACLAFVLHELAHKFMATYLGSAAEFKLDPVGVAITAISAFAGLPVIVPGAANITGYAMDKELLGKVALAGPIMNIVLALAAHLLVLNEIFILNLLFALINLLPFYILDGRKVYYWSRLVWVTSVIAAITLLSTWL